MRQGKTPNDFISEYYQTIKDQFPDLTLSQVSDICHSPFKLVVHHMREGSMMDIRLKYLGCFTIFPGRVKGLLTSTVKAYEDGKLGIEKLTRIKLMESTYTKHQKKNGENSPTQPSQG